MTFVELAEKTLEKAGKPLSPNEIWDLSKEFGIADQFHTEGKTPWQVLVHEYIQISEIMRIVHSYR